MSDPRDYKLDLSSAPAKKNLLHLAARKSKRSFISVHFACFGVYRRIYQSADGKYFAGHCPRCARPLRIRIDAAGIDARMFVVK
jgi:hypothetical protein